MTKTLFRWEQNGGGGEHGTATYFPGEFHEMTVSMPSFEQAHRLQNCIDAAALHAKLDAHRALLAQIARIEP